LITPLPFRGTGMSNRVDDTFQSNRLKKIFFDGSYALEGLDYIGSIIHERNPKADFALIHHDSNNRTYIVSKSAA
jgi:hypothetical protein